VPIIGNICMDMCMAEVTGLGAEAGDEAEIFGENITIDEISQNNLVNIVENNNYH